MIEIFCDRCKCRVGVIHDGGKPVDYVNNVNIQSYTRGDVSPRLTTIAGDFCVDYFRKACAAFTERLSRA